MYRVTNFEIVIVTINNFVSIMNYKIFIVFRLFEIAFKSPLAPPKKGTVPFLISHKSTSIFCFSYSPKIVIVLRDTND